jgi:hypothetical protein
MGLPPNLASVLRLTVERFWGIAAAAPHLASAELSVASSGAAVAAATGRAVATSKSVEWAAWPNRFWAVVRNAGSALLEGMHASRMRQAQRHIAEYRSRLPRAEGSPW